MVTEENKEPAPADSGPPPSGPTVDPNAPLCSRCGGVTEAHSPALPDTRVCPNCGVRGYPLWFLRQHDGQPLSRAALASRVTASFAVANKRGDTELALKYQSYLRELITEPHGAALTTIAASPDVAELVTLIAFAEVHSGKDAFKPFVRVMAESLRRMLRNQPHIDVAAEMSSIGYARQNLALLPDLVHDIDRLAAVNYLAEHSHEFRAAERTAQDAHDIIAAASKLRGQAQEMEDQARTSLGVADATRQALLRARLEGELPSLPRREWEVVD